MKRISDSVAGRKNNRKTGELQPEYKFDYSRAQPNRFVGRRSKAQVVVLLDPDVARVFTNPAAVNTALRAILSAVPSSRTASRRRHVPQ
jgi:hypothetical protein